MPADNFSARFAELIQERCVGAFTQVRLAEEISCHPNMIRHWKHGTHSPREDNLRRIAEAFEVPVSELAVESEPTPDQVPEEQAGEPRIDDTDLLGRLAELELEVSLMKLSEAAPHLMELRSSVPDLLHLLSEARQRAEESSR
jgi:transcriptional regulator with XRE-family HTH domain